MLKQDLPQSSLLEPVDNTCCARSSVRQARLMTAHYIQLYYKKENQQQVTEKETPQANDKNRNVFCVSLCVISISARGLSLSL